MNTAPPPPPTSGKWQPGQSGNPKGRPPGKMYKAALREALRKLADNGDPQQTLEEIATGQIVKAKAGDTAAAKELVDRLDGRVPQAIGGTDELPPLQGIAWLDPTESSGLITGPASNSSPSTPESSASPVSSATAEPGKP